MKSQKPLRDSWILVVILFFLVVGFAITSVLGYMANRDSVIHSEITQALPLISDNIYSEIKKSLIDPVNVSSLMANDTFLIHWVQEGESDLEEISEYLQYIMQRYDYDSAFFVSDITSNYYYYDGILKQISPDDVHDVWYYDFKNKNTSVDLDVDTDQASADRLTVFINHRLEDSQAEFLGVTGVGLKLMDIGASFRLYRDQFEHEVYLVSPEGLVQVHENDAFVQNLNITRLEGIRDIGQDLFNTDGIAHVFEYENENGLNVISSRYIPEFDWFLIVERNQEASLTMAKRALQRSILIGAVITILISSLILWIIRQNNRRLEHLAAYDSLTSLYNRRVFSQMLQRELRVAQRYHHSIGILMVDIDDFKTVNDQYGHFIGDQLLKRVAATIQEAVRESDLVGRWGGDEFIILLQRSGECEALQTSKRLMQQVQDQVLETEKGLVTTTISVGFACTDNVETAEWLDLILKADEALLESKRGGKGRVTGS